MYRETNSDTLHAAVDRLAALNAPTCDVGQMLREIEAGRMEEKSAE